MVIQIADIAVSCMKKRGCLGFLLKVCWIAFLILLLAHNSRLVMV